MAGKWPCYGNISQLVLKPTESMTLAGLETEIADGAQVTKEGYELRFLGKSYAKLLARTDTTTIVKPNEAHNALPENAQSENLS